MLNSMTLNSQAKASAPDGPFKEEEKLCSGCQESYPADAEFFYRDRRAKDGLRGVCKGCYSELPSVQKRQAKGAI
jgi:hypothetical protein